MEHSRTALIVGAGIGGLAAGIALRHRGWNVRLYDRRAETRQLGFGLLLAPNAMSALNELGIAEGIRSRTASGNEVEIRRLNGQLIRRFTTPLGGPAVVALRRELYDALLNAIGPDTLKLDREAVAVNDDPERVTVRFANGDVDSGAVLIGADGIHSIVRKQLHPNEPPPRRSGFSAVRGVAYGAGSCLEELAGVSYLDSGIEAAAIRAGSDAVYWYMSLLSSETPSDKGSVQSILGQRFRELDPVFRQIIAATELEDTRFDELFERDPLPTWGTGRMTLLGDAAHPLLPHTGQGAAQALEDAVALGLVLSSPQNVSDALRRYEHVRIYRTRKFVKLGSWIARVTTTRNAFVESIRNLAIRFVPCRVLNGWGRRISDPHWELRRTSSSTRE